MKKTKVIVKLMVSKAKIKVRVKRSHFRLVKKISWGDVVKKISQEYLLRTLTVLNSDAHSPPTFVLHNSFFPASIRKAYLEVKGKTKAKAKDLHIYTSLGEGSSTFGRHKDTMDVLIVQAIGCTSYAFDDGKVFRLRPGDSLFIPKGVYHEPLVSEPRVTLSFSW
jgi:ribosomal protein L16 Arg81 hydroxylase